MASTVIKRKLMKAEKAFDVAERQYRLLSIRRDETEKRYQKACKHGYRSFRYSLRMRLAVLNGVREVYYNYVMKKAEEMRSFRQHLSEYQSDSDYYIEYEDEDSENERF